MRIFLLAGALMLLLLFFWGRAEAQSFKSDLPRCTVAALSAGTCVPERQGLRVVVTNSDDTNDTDCASGTGSSVVTCEYDGSTWVSSPAIPNNNVGSSALDNTLCLSPYSIVVDPDEADTTDTYASLIYIDSATGLAAKSTTEADVDQFVMPSSGRIGLMYVNVYTDPNNSGDDGAEQWDITLRDDGAIAGVQSCSITPGNTTCTTSSSSTVSPGSLLDVLIESTDDSGGNPPTAVSQASVSFCFVQ